MNRERIVCFAMSPSKVAGVYQRLLPQVGICLWCGLGRPLRISCCGICRPCLSPVSGNSQRPGCYFTKCVRQVSYVILRERCHGNSWSWGRTRSVCLGGQSMRFVGAWKPWHMLYLGASIYLL